MCDLRCCKIQVLVLVLQPVDFDSLPNPVFNLTVYVQDIDATHVDTAYIEVQVTDYNDNAPVFMPNSKKVAIYENVTIGTTLHKFLASDKDIGINQQFTCVSPKILDILQRHISRIFNV